MTDSSSSCAWYRQLLAERVGRRGQAREVAVLRFLTATDDLDHYVALRSLKEPAFGVAMNTLGDKAK